MKNKKYAILTLAVTSIVALNSVSSFANTTITENKNSISTRSDAISGTVEKNIME